MSKDLEYIAEQKIKSISDMDTIAKLKFVINHRGYCKTREGLKSEIHKEYVENTSEVAK